MGRKLGVSSLLAKAGLLSMLMLSSCAGGSGRSGPGFSLSDPAALAGELPAPEALRDLSGLSETLIQGKYTLLRSSGALDQGNALELSGGSDTAWGLYGFDPELNAPDSLALSFSSAIGNELWVGLADYEKGVWEWHGPLTAGKTLAVDESRHLSPGGMLYCVVLADKGNTATVEALSIRTINPQNVAPLADLAANILSGDAPLPVTFDAAASTDFEGAIVQYAWDFDGNGGYEEFSDDPVLSHVFNNPGIYSVSLRVMDDQFAYDKAELEINVGVAGNFAPSAVLSLDPGSGLSPLLVSFDASGSSDPDGSIMLYEWDWEGDGSWDAYSSVSIVTHSYIAIGDFVATLRVSDDRGAQDIATYPVEVSDTSTDVPLANFEMSIDSGLAPLEVDFDASTSDPGFDPGDYIARYEWDFEGDGAYDSSSTSSFARHVYAYPGGYIVWLRVTDSTGASHKNYHSLSVYVNPITAANAGSDIDGNSMAVVGAAPAWAWYDSTDGSLRYRRARNESATDLADPIVVDSADDVGRQPSMAIVNGNPAISYYDATNTYLCFVRAIDPGGTAWGGPVDVDVTTPCGQFSSLAVVNGFPAISYMQSSKLHYVRALDQDGLAWDTPIELDSNPNMYNNSTLLVVSGKPAISYWDAVNNNLLYMRATDPDGAAWTAPVTVDHVMNDGAGGRMALVGGKPAIVYCDQASNKLLFARAADTDGTSWQASQVLSPSGFYASLAEVGGRAAVSYYKGTKLAYSRASDSAATKWSSQTYIAEADYTGFFTNIIALDGKPAISSQQSSSGDLLYFHGF